jgi:beta-mannosidase
MNSRRAGSLLVLASLVAAAPRAAIARTATREGASARAQSNTRTGAREVISLDSGWEFRQKTDGPPTDETKWRAAEVPGVVHTDLLRNKVIPDPFYRDNEAKLQWIEKADWEYRRTIPATPELLRHPHIDLVFKGLDTIADVYLNDKLILSADNMFREWRVDVKAELKPGENELRVEFRSVFPVMKELQNEDPSFSLTHNEGKFYIRKAAYEYGWDWGPRFVTSGIWQPVYLEVWDDARISDFGIRQTDVNADEANLTAEVEVTSSISGPATVKVEYETGGKKAEATREVTLHPGVNPEEIPITIPKPELWYPAGYGAQTLYDFRAEVSEKRKVDDETTTRTGLRKIVLRRDLDKFGRSFEFDVNGIPVFAKGAALIPLDSFPSRVTTEQIRGILQTARDANMNMVRVWGGGVYGTDEFYDICDELGIMVWQDFMFATRIPYSIRENVTHEAEYQVRRLRNHPSIALWSGNNELEGFMDDEQENAASHERAWIEYMALFSGILPRIVERLDAETPYIPSSPSAEYEPTSETFQAGDAHNWEVWHGNQPAEFYETMNSRFVSEFGFQAFPDMRTIEAFTLPEDRDVRTPVMDAHQKNNGVSGNEKIRDYLLKNYKEPKDFAAFVYLSQVLQAETVKTGAEHFRRNRPRTMGTLFWQLNDCWPVISWSSIDYYGRWKALQYYARRFYNDLLVSPHAEDGAVAVYVVSDRTATTAAKLRVRVMGFDGTVLSDKTQDVNMAPLSSSVYVRMPMEEISSLQGYDAAKSFVAAELTAGGKIVSRNTLYFERPKDLELPAAKLKWGVTQRGDGYAVSVSTDVLARDVFISAGELDATYSDNFFDLLPGESATVQVKTSATLEQLKAALKVTSMAEEMKANAPEGKAR